jgi:hypothetical protein
MGASFYRLSSADSREAAETWLDGEVKEINLPSLLSSPTSAFSCLDHRLLLSQISLARETRRSARRRAGHMAGDLDYREASPYRAKRDFRRGDCESSIILWDIRARPSRHVKLDDDGKRVVLEARGSKRRR